MVNLKKSWRDREEFLQLWGKLRSLLFDTPEYKAFRAEVIARASGRCQRNLCRKRGREVHHIITVYSDPMKAVDVTNGMYVCKACHKKEHIHGSQ